MPNLYTDADESAPTAQAPAAEKSEGDSNVATLPKTVLGGKEFKPGEEVVLRVVQVMDDSVLVEYASESGEEKAPEEAPAEAPAPAGPPGGGMASMYE